MEKKNPENKRGSKRCYNLQLKILASRKWKRMVEKIELANGRKAHDLYPVETKVWRPSLGGNYAGIAYAHRIYILDSFYREATERQLRQLLMHEMAHSFLDQNGNRDRHGQYFRTVCYLLGLHTETRERPYSYIRRCSECGYKHRRTKQGYPTKFCPVCNKITECKVRRTKAKLKVKQEPREEHGEALGQVPIQELQGTI